MNDLLLTLGVESWKPAIAALLMPPVPFIVLVLAGARLMFRRRLLAWCLVLLGVVGIWLMCTVAVSEALRRALLAPPRALIASDLAELKRAPKTAIVVLGGGRRALAPEYGISTLSPLSVERLRYGIFLARETALPVAFSGGVGHGSPAGLSEAEIAARVAEREFGFKLRWQETESRDTRENAIKTLALLKPQGIEHIVLVTHDFHIRRALGNFERAGAASGGTFRFSTAPMGLPAGGTLAFGDWLPGPAGFALSRMVLHEWLGRLAGA
ncbi:MAG: YdcF family protein [Chitinophagaceae bacterium]|nr:YdcF family protein [Rubrivivax sp.]